MRRPPVVLIVVAVLSTGVGFGWAATSDRESPSLSVVSVPRPDDTAAPADPELSSTEQAIEPVTVPTDDHESAESPEPAVPGEGVEPGLETVATPAESTPPAHLGERTTPLVVQPDPVPAPTTTVATAASAPPAQVTVAFSASQAYGTCGEQIPYDIFSGTADPGSTVTISSPHGSGSVTADGSGHWERKVEFAGAPRGSTFEVAVSGVGGSKTFEFTVGE